MIKTILVPATGDRGDVAVFEAALNVAREFNAHLEVLHTRLDAVDTAVKMTPEASGTSILIEDLIEQLERDAGEREAKAKQFFDDFCARQSLAIAETPTDQARTQPTAQWWVETGDEAQSMTAHGMAADLVIAGRGIDYMVTGRAVLEAALLETGRPLLIPSLATAAPLLGGTIAIAWKPTPQTVRAVAASMPFITRAKNVVVITAEEERTPEKADRLVRCLAWHGCQATAVLLKDNGHVVETVFAAAKESADLLVMGGYGHNRLREWAFGGFTRRALEDAPLPVLMAH